MTPYLVVLMFASEPGTYDESQDTRRYQLKASDPIDAAKLGWVKVVAEYPDRSLELESVFVTYHNGMDN